MAFFFHPDSGIHAFVSFKALYSRFSAASEWIEVAVDPTPRHLIRVIGSGRLRRSFHLMRCPYKRTVSCFMDKYRKQPNRIDAAGFEWQHCHSILYPSLGINAEASDAEIAARFLAFSFDEFISLLPTIYDKDGHFKPQDWSNRLLIGNKHLFRWPFCTTINIEDSESLAQIPGIDFSVKTNTTSHIERDFELEDRHRKVIRRLYRRDFLLGGYATS